MWPEMKENEGLEGGASAIMESHALFWTRSRKRPDRPRIVLIAWRLRKLVRMRLRIGIQFSYDSSTVE
jgi:hypothetical protein